MSKSTAVITLPEAVHTKRISKADYEKEMQRLQVQLVRLQEWVIHHQLRVMVIFEGRDTAGKGGTIKRILERLNARYARVVALGTPTERERTQWYFQRYVQHLPAGGEIVLFDRSWYNRAGVERVMGFCTEEEHEEFLRTCPVLERALVRSGIVLVKYWLSLSDEEQERRFLDRINNPGKRWKLSPMDLEARARWVDYAEAKDEMFAYTDIREAPWYVVDANDKREARLNLVSHLLSLIPYDDVPHEKVDLPPRQQRAYSRPPIDSQTWVPQRYKVRVRADAMRKYVIMGIQGSGKGTQAKLLAADFDLVHISVGDIFRWNVQHHTKLGAQVKRTMAAGRLVDDDLVERVVKERIDAHDWNYGFIIDGFPRNARQAEFFLETYDIDGVINLEMPPEEVHRRVLARRLCEGCGLDYNLMLDRPEQPETCDVCGGRLVTREDDNPEALAVRIQEYWEQTKPVLEIFNRKEFVFTVDASRPIDEVQAEIRARLAI